MFGTAAPLRTDYKTSLFRLVRLKHTFDVRVRTISFDDDQTFKLTLFYEPFVGEKQFFVYHLVSPDEHLKRCCRRMAIEKLEKVYFRKFQTDDLLH